MKKLTALDVLTQSPVIPVMVIDNLKNAVPLAKTLVESGIKVLEITLRTECGLDAIKLIKQEIPDAIVGAGTVLNPVQFEQAIIAGAQFIISPGITESLLQKSILFDVSFIPGVATASEIMLAKQYDLHCLKFFPAEINGGIKALQAFSSVFPEITFCPTGGINEKNYLNYLNLKNVMCVGGSWFVPLSAVKQENFALIAQLAQSTIEGIQ
ncbi:bifunctional 4-hydroxy-2-oxoglutarate aldolase/2-dehydro-3-deoxy-phosphogluconate aldolase [Lonepinella koalarum]|uniref:2-dehydro-3-deoxy-phosphogluconate aldolase n=1 Tax=Lonepinella koalarum TaxID=53417 RepID=A0A4R1L362_9PAST|nr:bifunctional 4-hydroxy-2-oxoglutarate aldolase/2-dehydro-3-deoxy-phosphogluconate aldolase [Lonepinella koalarum]MDH2926212.1 keto-deoxy-phosphogluconate aldolase [Lonepinella koalarum]TCK71363.1 2-keto-3-deoxy-phosphogluconate aldolase [Lonepinella koalarum]TFJ91076.1 bifunctional 4-hydroxy-2-oxoglutarate aldolase/2-dehydro-3-deoxy-phosphogluconate aldolase [Lonepinella koalarum]